MSEQKGTKAMLRTLGVSLVAVGCGYMIFGLLPYIQATYQKTASEKAYNDARKEIESLQAWGQQIFQKELWFPIMQKRSDNPAWMEIANERERYNNQVKAANERENNARQAYEKARQTIEAKGTHAGLSVAIAIAGVIALLVSRKANA